MLSFYDFPSWVFLFFLIALAVTIFFYSRKFLRVFTALDMDKSEQQPSKPPKPQKQPNKGQRNEKELNQSAKATGGSDGKIPKSKERLESRSVVAVCPPDQRGHRKIEESIITKSQAKIINHPPKLLQSSSSRTQLDRVPEVIVKTCTTVEEVIKKNELFVERMRFTENVEPKKLRNIP
ncbi:uncharacterized protein LOC141855212 isoform X2 [Brevipalpus obovatus]|uniref:uncharacterized protein LOC141855212 isoform X2 n=1 Tax=Brevipalpus obovatus TaxID=246614 RepID=UPI003D9F7C9B